jgi:hypothetical protein
MAGVSGGRFVYRCSYSIKSSYRVGSDAVIAQDILENKSETTSENIKRVG